MKMNIPTCYKNMDRTRELRKKMVLDGILEGIENLFLFKLNRSLQI